MDGASQTATTIARLNVPYWGIWAERAVVRAMEIDPDQIVVAGLLHGQPTWQVTLTIARAVGYLAGTQRAPELDPAVRAWIDHVGLATGTTAGPRLGAFSWGEWADRAAIIALEVDGRIKMTSALLRGEGMWEVAMTIARSVGCLAGTRRILALPPEVLEWLHVGPRPDGRPGSDNRSAGAP